MELQQTRVVLLRRDNAALKDEISLEFLPLAQPATNVSATLPMPQTQRSFPIFPRLGVVATFR